jgi:4-hydroxy-3-methylbut-2-enyl diphosphate reductase
MQIEIDSSSGFCYGVTKTIQLAEKALNEGQPMYCLGEIVHNEEEVERLKSKGLVVINKDDLKNMSGSNILIRAHGEPGSTYQKIEAGSNQLHDGTCPIVLHLQKKVHDAWTEMKAANGQVIIYGKKGHAEVIGLAGQTNDEALIVSHKEELRTIDFTRPIAIFAQTTQSTEGYSEIISEIKREMTKFFPAENLSLRVTDSICKHVSKRGEHLAEFSKKHDLIIFVSGTNSSNGKVLFEVCKKSNPKSFWVPNAGEVKKEWFLNAKSVGICGATSTPQWLMEKVAEKIKMITNSK